MSVQAVSLTREGWAYLDSRTWHASMFVGDHDEVECFEVAWDGGGAFFDNRRSPRDDRE